MGICPICGEWVDEGDICMSCGGGSAGSADESYDDFGKSGHVYRYDPSPQDIRENQKRSLKWEWEMYDDCISSARKQDDYKARLKHYSDALEHVRKYWDISRRSGLHPYDMPKMGKALPDADVEWLRERHYKTLARLGFFKNEERDALEEFFERSGYADVITENNSKYQEELQAHAAFLRIEKAKRFRQDYFKHIEKANAFVDEDKLKKAMKEYRKADNCWRNYFNYDFRNDPHREKMPENKFSSGTVEHMIEIYVKTHPLLTSKKKQLEINRQIVEMLDGKWESHIREADRKAREIHDERQRKKRELLNKASDAIAGAMIVGDKIISRLKR